MTRTLQSLTFTFFSEFLNTDIYTVTLARLQKKISIDRESTSRVRATSTCYDCQFSFSFSLGVIQHLNSQEGRQAFWQLTLHTPLFLFLAVIIFFLVSFFATVFFFFACFWIALFFLAYPVSGCFSSFFATFLGTA